MMVIDDVDMVTSPSIFGFWAVKGWDNPLGRLQLKGPWVEAVASAVAFFASSLVIGCTKKHSLLAHLRALIR